MKKTLLKFILPIMLGLFLTAISAIGIVGCEPVCGSGELAGTNGDCMTCGGNVPSYSWYPGCSNINNGVYCCP